MHARPVIGGVFIRMLSDRDIWNKWAGADKTKVGHWAPLPPIAKNRGNRPNIENRAGSLALTQPGSLQTTG